MKLFPLLSTLFAHCFTTQHVRKLYDNLQAGIAKEDFTMIDLLHHLTSGLKSVFSQDCFDGCLLIRQSLGGAGYSAWSGIPLIITETSANPTFEGDNSVMAQQAFNYILKQGKQVMKEGKCSEPDLAF